MTINQALNKHVHDLQNSKTPRLDAEILLTHVLGKPREWILAHPEHELTPELITDYESLVNRRKKSEPIAYILGHKDFYGLKLTVNESVLIPRPETELIVELGLSELLIILRNILRNSFNDENVVAIDVGTGSGAIIISLANQLRKNIGSQNIKFIGTDVSKDALEIAKNNAKAHKIDDKIKFIHSDLLENEYLQSSIKKYRTAIILANLPYISEELYEKTEKNVRNFEPKSALISGKDGLNHYKKLLNQINSLIATCQLQTICLFEISPEQKTIIKKEITKRFPNAKIDFHKDLAGKWRLVKFSL